MNNNIEPTAQGWANEPKPKKSRSWTWILLAVIVLCLCLAALGAGVYFFLSTRSATVSTQQPGGGDYPPAPTLAPLATQIPAPTEVPTLPTSLVVEPYIPGDDYDYSIFDLAFLYEASPDPGVQNWDVAVNVYDSVVIEQGWCAVSEEILAQNLEHLEFKFTADGEEFDLANLYTDDDRYCLSYLGIIQAWPPGDHLIIIEMILDAPINDGWGDYSAGQYIDQFIISATP